MLGRVTTYSCAENYLLFYLFSLICNNLNDIHNVAQILNPPNLLDLRQTFPAVYLPINLPSQPNPENGGKS
jgi:hypothetical protein